MKKESIYNSKNIFLLLGVFTVIFSLLYALTSFLHEKQKIDSEILLIKEENERYLAEIEIKKRKLEYLKTPQRIDKEAKTQIQKKQAGEQVLVFIEENIQTIPEEKTIKTETELFLPVKENESSKRLNEWIEKLIPSSTKY